MAGIRVGGDAPPPRPPSLLDALSPVIVLVLLLALTIVLFGIDASLGPLQVGLMASGVFAGLVAMKNGHDPDRLREAAVSGISSAMGAIFILLAVGALIGTWNMAGTIPTVVSYGVAILKPAIFYAAVAVICALVGAVTGSSWTTAGTLGVAFVGMAPVLGLSTAIAAGAVISGAYVGDKMSPLSETTILVPTLVGGVSVTQHIRGMIVTVAPAFGVAVLLYLGIGLTTDIDADPASVDAARHAIADAFWISPLNLLPILALVILTIRKVSPYLTIFLVALGTGVLACITQPDVVDAFVGGDDGRLRTSVEAIYKAMGSGFQLSSGNATIDGLFSGGGMTNMLSTVWLILAALSFAAIMEEAGFLDRLIEPVLRRAKTATGLILSVVATCLGLNVIAGDQYVAVVLPSRVFRVVFARRGLAPRMLSRTVEDTGTVTSVLVPWNSCGAYMTGVLGVSTMQYLPYAFFNYLNPLVAVAYALTGFRIERVPPSDPETHSVANDGTSPPTERVPGGAFDV
jgi:Na+:H+ antiporter, NhaC family